MCLAGDRAFLQQPLSQDCVRLHSVWWGLLTHGASEVQSQPPHHPHLGPLPPTHTHPGAGRGGPGPAPQHLARALAALHLAQQQLRASLLHQPVHAALRRACRKQMRGLVGDALKLAGRKIVELRALVPEAEAEVREKGMVGRSLQPESGDHLKTRGVLGEEGGAGAGTLGEGEGEVLPLSRGLLLYCGGCHDLLRVWAKALRSQGKEGRRGEEGGARAPRAKKQRVKDAAKTVDTVDLETQGGSS